MSRYRPTKDVLLSSIIELTPELHKGECGKVMVIGGAEMYTGAPFFSAMSALRTGADLAYIVCERSAGIPIKSYSPDVIVHPYLVSSNDASVTQDTQKEVVAKVAALLSRMDVVIIGPGLGRDELTLQHVADIIEEAKKKAVPMVLDGDALYLVHTRPELIKGYELAVLTPNVVEFERLCKSMKLKFADDSDSKDTNNMESGRDRSTTKSRKLADAFGGVTVVQKGEFDVISNGVNEYIADNGGGSKRCGGQGDLLTGALGVWLAWAVRLANGAKGSHEEEDNTKGKESGMSRMPCLPSGTPASLVAAYAACTLIRHASAGAYKRLGRGVQASDMIEEIAPSFSELVEYWRARRN